MFRLFRLGDQLVNGLAREELVRQVDAPGSGEIGSLNSNRNAGSEQAEEFASGDPERTENLTVCSTFRTVFSVLSVPP
jgi:hypothetical protein